MSFQPIFPAALQAAGASSAGVVAFTRVRVLFDHADGSVALDTLVDFPASSDAVALSLNVPLGLNVPASGEVMTFSLAYINAAGDTVFRGGPVPVTVVPSLAGDPQRSAISIQVNYTGPGSTATNVVIAPRTLTVFNGDLFALSAVAHDANAQALPGTPIVWTSLDPTRATITAPAAGSGIALGLRGSARIVAQLLTGAADTVLVNVILHASTMTVQSGNAQTGLIAAALPLPLVVKVAAPDGVGVAGVSVAFTVASGHGTISTATAVSDTNGLAQTTWTLGTATGSQSVTATAASLANSALTFSATALATPPATQLKFITQPSSTVATVAGAIISPAIVVAANDASGNVATGFTGSVTLSFGSNPGQATLGGSTTVAAVAGIATFSTITVNRPGVGYALNVNSGSLTPDVSGSFTVATGAAANIAIVGGNLQSVLGGFELPNPLVVLVTDANGNPVSGATVNWAVTSGGGSVSAASSVTSSSGIVTNIWTLGSNISTQTVSAAAASPAGSALTGSPLTFTATSVSSVANKAWTGAVSTAWTLATNWSPVGVPSSTDSVLVALANNLPQLSTSTTIAGLTLSSGAILTLSNGAVLADNGLLDATGSITGTGTVSLTGTTRRASGTLGVPLAVTGSYTLGGPLTVSGTLVITGALNVDTTAISVGDSLVTRSNGVLNMTTNRASVTVNGPALFAGGTSVLNAGTLALLGNFTQASGSTSFAATAAHTTRLAGSAATGGQLITFGNPGTGSAGSHFANLVNANDGTSPGLSLNSDVYADGVLSMSVASTDSVSFSGTSVKLVVQGASVAGGTTSPRMVFNGVELKLTDGATFTQLDGLTFRNFTSTGTNFEFARSSGSYTLQFLRFENTPTGGNLLNITGTSPSVTLKSPLLPTFLNWLLGLAYSLLSGGASLLVLQ